jgi:hypothetical protein
LKEKVAILEKQIDTTTSSINNELVEVDNQESNKNVIQIELTENDISDHLRCPITQETFITPVIAADGHTYESKAINEWLETHNTSPMTNMELIIKIYVLTILLWLC